LRELTEEENERGGGRRGRGTFKEKTASGVISRGPKKVRKNLEGGKKGKEVPLLWRKREKKSGKELRGLQVNEKGLRENLSATRKGRYPPQMKK